MIPVLGIPTLNQGALLRRCLASIDHPLDRLVLVANDSSNQSVRETFMWIAKEYQNKTAPWRRMEVIASTANFGVAGSWNTIIKLFPAPYWVLVNDDIKLGSGDLAKLESAVNSNPTAACFYANHGASFWAVTAEGVSRVGLLDECFFPAYCEDVDWGWRADCLGITRVNVQDCKSVHGVPGQGGSCTVNSASAVARENMRTHGLGFAYFEAKWGGRDAKPVCKHPFNDPHFPMWAFKFDPALRVAQQWKM